MSKEGLERPKGGKIWAKAAQLRTEKASLPRAGSPALYVMEHITFLVGLDTSSLTARLEHLPQMMSIFTALALQHHKKLNSCYFGQQLSSSQ